MIAMSRMKWIVFSAFIYFALSGCAVVEVNQQTPPGYARVTIGKLDNGRDAVGVFAVYYDRHRYDPEVTSIITSHEPLVRKTENVSWLSMRPGHYLLNANCYLPDANIPVYFEAIELHPIVVKANKTYTLSCAYLSESDHDTKLVLIPDSN